MSPEVDQQNMTADEWFKGGQNTILEQISGIKNREERVAAMKNFTHLNNHYMQEKLTASQAPTPGLSQDKPKTHPAIDQAINQAIAKESRWMEEIKGYSNDQLKDRFLSRQLQQDVVRNRVDPQITLAQYKQLKPELVELANKYSRDDLERKEVLTRMVKDRKFDLNEAKVVLPQKQWNRQI